MLALYPDKPLELVSSGLKRVPGGNQDAFQILDKFSRRGTMKDDQFSATPRLNKPLASRLIGGFLVCSALTPFPVLAQAASTSASGPQVEDIVVTAQRRSESLQSVPIAVSAITSDQAADRKSTRLNSSH